MWGEGTAGATDRVAGSHREGRRPVDPDAPAWLELEETDDGVLVGDPQSSLRVMYVDGDAPGEALTDPSERPNYLIAGHGVDATRLLDDLDVRGRDGAQTDLYADALWDARPDGVVSGIAGRLRGQWPFNTPELGDRLVDTYHVHEVGTDEGTATATGGAFRVFPLSDRGEGVAFAVRHGNVDRPEPDALVHLDRDADPSAVVDAIDEYDGLELGDVRGVKVRGERRLQPPDRVLGRDLDLDGVGTVRIPPEVVRASSEEELRAFEERVRADVHGGGAGRDVDPDAPTDAGEEETTRLTDAERDRLRDLRREVGVPAETGEENEAGVPESERPI